MHCLTHQHGMLPVGEHAPAHQAVQCTGRSRHGRPTPACGQGLHSAAPAATCRMQPRVTCQRGGKEQSMTPGARGSQPRLARRAAGRRSRARAPRCPAPSAWRPPARPPARAGCSRRRRLRRSAQTRPPRPPAAPAAHVRLGRLPPHAANLGPKTPAGFLSRRRLPVATTLWQVRARAFSL